MKTARTFKGSWSLLAMVAAIILGEVLIWGVADRSGIRTHPVSVVFLCLGLVVAFAMVLYDEADIT